MAWDENKIEQLKELWLKGVPTAEIGRVVGASKNAVIGKAHRLGLNTRPSPIKRADDAHEDGAAETGPAHAGKENQAILPKEENEKARSKKAGEKIAGKDKKAAAAEAHPKERKASVKKKSAFVEEPVFRRSNRCCWPLGEPGEPDFHFCDAEILVGRPYCPEHSAIAYVKIRDRRNEE